MVHVPLRQVLARHGWLVAIAAIYLYVFPYYPKLHSANELPRVYLVSAIVDDHTFAVDRGVQRWGSSPDLAHVHDLNIEHVLGIGDPVRRAQVDDGHYYANKAPGASLLVVPVYTAVKWITGAPPSLAQTMWLARIVTGVIPTLFLLWLLWGFLERFAPDPAIRRLVLVAYALGSMAMTYSVLYYSHQLSAVCIASAWILAIDVAERRRGIGAMALAGLLAGMAPLVDYQAAFAAVPLLVDIVRRLRDLPRARLLAVAVGAATVPIVCLFYYHAACFGSPFSTGYNYSTTYAGDHVRGLLGMTYPTWTAFAGTMLTPDNGFVTLAPWWLLAIPGGVLLWRRGERGVVLVVAVIALVFVYFVSSITGWRAGWEVGPRYIVALQPFLLPLVCVALSEWRQRPLAIGAACGAVLVGVVIYTLTTATLPYWPDLYKNPLYEVTFRLLGDGLAAPCWGRLFGVPMLVAIAPFVLGVAALVGWSIARVTTPRGLVLAIAISVCAVGAFALVPRTGARGQAAYTNTLYPAVAR